MNPIPLQSSKDKKFYLETFGCQMNVVDSEWIATILTDLGYSQTDQASAADLIILNTCSVREKAERKVYGHLGGFKPLKDKNPDLILAVGGCVAQQEKERLLQKVPYLDIVFGTHNVHKFADMLEELRADRIKRCETGFKHSAERFDAFPARRNGTGISRFVTIMQGCDNFCTYCIVPYVRGREVSRKSEDIVAEVNALVETGVREITLLGQNVNSYGQSGDGEISFAQLLHDIHAIEGLQRIRFTSSHPKDLSDELIACFHTLPKVCPQLHLALQSGSNRILAAMRRGYTREEYLERIECLRHSCPDIRLSTDIIVGFPGETREDFLDTLDMLGTVGFCDAFTFLYSPRPETKAATFADPIPQEYKQAWFDELLATQKRISARIWAEDVDTYQRVLVEGVSRHGEGQLFGRNVWNRIVNFDGAETLVGQETGVRIVRSLNNSHLGVLEDQ